MTQRRRDSWRNASQDCDLRVFKCVVTKPRGEADVFVQFAGAGQSTRAMCTTVRYTDDGRLVLTLADTAEQVVLLRRGRYELPLIAAHVGRHTEVTLAGPDGVRIILQLEQRKRPRRLGGDEAVAAC
jgi:hypothetical protein